MGEDDASIAVKMKEAAEIENHLVNFLRIIQKGEGTADMVLKPFLYLVIVTSKKLQPEPNEALFPL